jgi:RNA polymerase sigma-70 factor (ECF subfamily)
MLLSSPTDPDGINLPGQAGRSDARAGCHGRAAENASGAFPKFLTHACYKSGMSFGRDFASTLTAARRGDRRALADLYEAFQPRILRYLLTQEPKDGEDLASEVWLDIRGGLNRFEGTESDLLCWIFTIARRRLIDHRRTRARRRTDPVDMETLTLPTEELDPTRSLEYGEALSCLALLPREWAEIVLLRVVGGLDSAEVATITGRKAGTVRVIQKRALERLAALLSADRERVVTR